MVQAGLIVHPGGGTVLFTLGDDETTHVELGSTFSLYGEDFTSFDVSTNGNVNFSGNASFSNPSLPNGPSGGLISPLWDDLVLTFGSRITERRGDGWFAVTWSRVSTWADLDQRYTFQFVQFNEAREFAGFNFEAGDIAFAYGPMGSALNLDDLATVGLQSFDGTMAAGLPDGETTISASDLGKLHSQDKDFILYRFNGEGYDVSYNPTLRTVPEPATFTVLAIGILVALRRRRR